MPEETIITAARRVVRFIRIDDHKNGGLLSIDTIQAADTLEHQMKIEEAREKEQTDASRASRIMERDNGGEDRNS